MEAMSDAELLGIWADVMREMRRRGMIRTWNNPVADVAESLVARRLGLTLAGNSEIGYDGIDANGRRYQIKARRLTDNRRQLSQIRSLDRGGFDDLVIVLFEEDFTLRGRWRVPIEVVRDRATFHMHVNTHILHARDKLLNDPRVERITGAMEGRP